MILSNIRFRLFYEILAYFLYDREHASRSHILSSDLAQWQLLNKNMSHILSILLFRSKSHQDPVFEHGRMTILGFGSGAFLS